MSSGPVYPSHSVSIDPEQLCGDATAGIVVTDWYSPGQYAFNDPYNNSNNNSYHPGTNIDSHHQQPSWNNNSYTRTPSVAEAPYAVQPHQLQQAQAPSSHQPTPQQSQQQTPQPRDFDRPRSSPSTFGPSPENIPWMSNGLGIHYSSATQTPALTSAFPPGVFQNNALEPDHYSTSARPEIHHPHPHRRPYTSIAPNPHGPAGKRKRDEEENQHQPQLEGSAGPGGQSKQPKRKRTSSVVSSDLTEEDRFLVQLKQEENLPWKDIANRFQTEKGRNMQVAALQMRYKRLREKFRVWEEQDVHALKLAHEYWEKYKWEIISGKMLDFNIIERWPPRHCSRKWQELESTSATHVATTVGAGANSINQNLTPVSMPPHFSSPVEGQQVHFAFMPMS